MITMSDVRKKPCCICRRWFRPDPRIAFGLEMERRGDAAYSQDEWRRALRQAVERAAALESKLETAKAGMLNEAKE